jgi:hypothetical protein
MIPMRNPFAYLGALALLALVASCGDDQDPAGASALWDEINAGAGFRSWRRAPDYPERRPSFTAHGRQVEIFISSEMSSALAGASPIGEWPVGSTLVKEGFSKGGARVLVAAMKKRGPGDWFWAEYTDDGEPRFSGRPAICVDCHDDRATYSDWVYSVELPR